MKHKLLINIVKYTAFLGLVCIGLTSCDDDETQPDPNGNIKTSGILVTGTAASGSVFAKYVEEIPVGGTVDLTSGQDFVEFWPTAMYDHRLFVPSPDGTAGFSKMVINLAGQLEEEAVLPVVDESSFRIAVKNADVGVFQDRATPNTITIFNPTSFQVTGSIDMTNGLDPIDSLEQRYQRFLFRGDDVFAPIRTNSGLLFSGLYLHQGNVSTKQYVGSTSAEAPFSGGVLTVNNFGQNVVDTDGSLYFQDGGAIGTGTFARVYRILAGSNEIDENYVFEPFKP